jgi:hypothetical protein
VVLAVVLVVVLDVVFDLVFAVVVASSQTVCKRKKETAGKTRRNKLKE